MILNMDSTLYTTDLLDDFSHGKISEEALPALVDGDLCVGEIEWTFGK